ncbi:MAG TPA: hypothetical protein DIT64_15910 [Verrucomicrobiales bacterium]|nr:hypothetical protein [Verrucomicrobiales bacterium]
MTRLPAFLALISCAALSARAQLPQAIVEAQRAKLLEGVESVPKTGAPGPVAIWGQTAFPLLAAPDRAGAEIAVAAAAGFGKGRILLLGHNGYLEGAAGGGHARLMANCARWTANKEKPRIGLHGVRAHSFYEPLGSKVETLNGPLQARALSGLDLLVLNAQGVTDAEQGAAILEWVKNGGGLIAGMTGWAFAQTSGGKDLAAAHGLNHALMEAGLAFTDQGNMDAAAYAARTRLPALMNAADAVQALKRQRDKAATLSDAEALQAASAIQLAMSAQPPGRSQLQEAVLAALGGADARSRLPAPQSPLTQAAHAADRIRLGMETRVLRLASAPAAHPAHESFPGKAPAAAPRVSREVSVNPAIPGWTSTGLYAAAGEPVRVQIPAERAGKGYALRIGCHSDTLYHLDSWLRAPEITKSASLDMAETTVSSAFGGLIYIVVPDKAADGTRFTCALHGGIPAPHFVLGLHSDAQWAGEISRHPAPWGEFECGNIILSCPADTARAVRNPAQLMEFWKKVVEAQDEITNQAAERRRPERIVADVQISAGYMHSGYPIMIPVSAAEEMVTFNRLKFPGWGFYHEIGHNHQRPHFTFEGTGEVTNNVIGMWCYEAVLGKDWLIGHPNITAEARAEHIQKIKRASDKWAVWKSDPFLALTTYIQLVQAFGWDSWRKYLHSFADPAHGPMPAGDDERRDQFLVRYSKIVNRDLGPLFDFWGIPVSPAAKASVAGLEPWMPKM